MYYVYILQSQTDKRFYVGYTLDVHKRLLEHNSGKNASTKRGIPYELIHFEGFLNKADALEREKYLKSGYGLRSIKVMLKVYLNEL